MGKGAAADAYISPAYGTDAAFGLVGYLCRGGMVAMPLCTGSLRARLIQRHLEKRLGVGAAFARSGGQWRARKPQRSAAAGEHRTGEHPAQRTIDAHAAQQTFGWVQGCSSPAPLPFGENGVPRGSASWSRPQAAKTERARLASLSGLIYDPGTPSGVQLGVLPAIPARIMARFSRET